MRGNYESYAALLVDAIRARGIGFVGAVAMRTSHEMSVMFQYLVAPMTGPVVRFVALGALIILSGLGVRPQWRRAPATSAFLAAYLVIVLFWPYTPGRFVWGIWPLVCLLPVLGVRVVLKWKPTARHARLTRTAVLACAAGVACGYVGFNVLGYRANAWSAGSYASRLQPLLVHVATKTSPDAVLASEAENTVYLYTGRSSVPLGSFAATDYLKPRSSRETAAGIAVVLERYHPSAVVVTTPYLRAATTELAARQPPLLTIVDTFPGGGLVLVPARR